MNITNFQFKQTPFSKIKRYEIRTLNEEGTNYYMKKDSYVHRFLKSLDHERIDDLFDYRNKKLIEVSENKPKDQPKNMQVEQLNFLKTKSEDEQIGKLITENIKSERETKILRKSYSFKKIQPSESINKDAENTPKNCKEKLFFPNTLKINRKHRKSENPISVRHSLNIKSKNINDLPQDKHLIDLKYKENHVQGLNNLKETLRDYGDNSISKGGLKFSSTSSRFFTSHRKRNHSLGFTSFQVPNLKKERLHTSGDTNIVSTPNPKFQILKKSLLKTFNVEKHDDTKELARMQMIIQTNENLENIDRLPKISTICNQTKLKSIYIKLKSNKIMGERYNPMNFYHNQSKSTTRRNIFGALFQH